MKKYEAGRQRTSIPILARVATATFAALLAVAFASVTSADAGGTPWWRETVPAAVIEGTPFGKGERLRYTVRVLGKDAGTGELRVGRSTSATGREVRALSAQVRSSGFFDKVYPVRDDAVSHLDVATATPVRAELSVDENRRPARTIDLNFTGFRGGRVQGERRIGDQTESIDVLSPVRAHDPLSALYHLRSRVLAEGDGFPLFIHNGKRMYRCAVQVAGKEEVWTDLGMKEGWKLELRITRADGSRPDWRQRFTLWLSTDYARVPLKLSFPMPVGHVEAVLSAARGIAAAPPPAAAAPGPPVPETGR